MARMDPCLEGVLLHGKNGFGYEDRESFYAGLDAVLFEQTGVDYRKNAENSVERFSTEQFAASVENIYYHVTKTHQNILSKMANKVADKIGYVRTGVKPLDGPMAMNLGNSDMDASRIALGCMRMEKMSVQEAGRLVNVAL